MVPTPVFCVSPRPDSPGQLKLTLRLLALKATENGSDRLDEEDANHAIEFGGVASIPNQESGRKGDRLLFFRWRGWFMVGAWVHILYTDYIYPIINLCLLECWLEQLKFTKISETKETGLLSRLPPPPAGFQTQTQRFTVSFQAPHSWCICGKSCNLRWRKVIFCSWGSEVGKKWAIKNGIYTVYLHLVHFMENVGRYTIHGSSGLLIYWFVLDKHVKEVLWWSLADRVTHQISMETSM